MRARPNQNERVNFAMAPWMEFFGEAALGLGRLVGDKWLSSSQLPCRRGSSLFTGCSPSGVVAAIVRSRACSLVLSYLDLQHFPVITTVAWVWEIVLACSLSR